MPRKQYEKLNLANLLGTSGDTDGQARHTHFIGSEAPKHTGGAGQERCTSASENPVWKKHVKPWEIAMFEYPDYDKDFPHLVQPGNNARQNAPGKASYAEVASKMSPEIENSRPESKDLASKDITHHLPSGEIFPEQPQDVPNRPNSAPPDIDRHRRDRQQLQYRATIARDREASFTKELSEILKGDAIEKTPLEVAKEIIDNIDYINLATKLENGDPWSTPVHAVHDKEYNFFWTSGPDAEHSKYIERENGNISFTIYDSTAPAKTGKGVYVKANARPLTEEKEIADALICIYEKLKIKNITKTAKDFMEGSERRIYIARPKEVWINEVKQGKKYISDIRVSVDLLGTREMSES